MPRQVGAEQEQLCGYNKFSLLPITLNNYLGREFLAVAQEQPLSQQMKYCHCNEHFSQRQLRKEKGNPCLIISLFAKNSFCLYSIGCNIEYSQHISPITKFRGSCLQYLHSLSRVAFVSTKEILPM